MKGKRRQEKAGNKNIPCLRVVEIRYVPTSDAGLRLSHAIDILLRSATKEPKEASINAEKEAESPQGSPLIEATETKDGSQSN